MLVLFRLLLALYGQILAGFGFGLLRPAECPPELEIEQRAAVLRWFQLADADSLTRRNAVGIDTASTEIAIRDTADRYRGRHGGRAEVVLGAEVLAAAESCHEGLALGVDPEGGEGGRP